MNQPLLFVQGENLWLGKTKQVKYEELHFSGKDCRRLKKTDDVKEPFVFYPGMHAEMHRHGGISTFNFS